MSRIAAYTFVEAGAAATGTPHPAFNATATIGVIEQVSGTTTYARPTVPKPFYAAAGSDQLTAWQTALNGAGIAGTYQLDYDASTGLLTIETTNAVSFRPVMVGNSAEWTGFTQALGGWATSWTAQAKPAAVVELIACTVEPAEDAARVDLHEWRHGRAAVVAWGNHQLHRVTLFLTSSNLRAMDPGYLMSGRVQIQQGTDTTAYSPTNVDGVVDGYVIASSDPVEDGDLGEVWQVSLLVAVPRV